MWEQDWNLGIRCVGSCYRAEMDCARLYLSLPCSYYDKISLKQRFKEWDEMETAFVDSVRCIGSDSGSEPLNHVCITLRIPVSLVFVDPHS